jgi:uncharacterized protein (TIGR00266 family)
VCAFLYVDILRRVNAEESRVVGVSGLESNHDPGIEMRTDTGSGGLLGSAKRSMLGGESVFMNTFTAQQPGSVTLAPPAPGDVRARFLDEETIYADSGSYLASEPNVEVSTEFQGTSKFFTRGDVFLLTLTGTGTVFVDSYGAMETVELERGEQFNVDTEHIVAFDSTVQYSTVRPGGVKSRAFGGERKVVTFSGPGKIWILNRDFESLAEKVAGEIPGSGGGGDDDDGIGVDDFLRGRDATDFSASLADPDIYWYSP